VDAKISQLKGLQAQITALLAQRDQQQDDQVKSLVKTYSAMKPVNAARIFETMPDTVLIPVAQTMKSDVLAPILAQMNPDTAQKLTVKLANKLTLPDTTSALAPVPPAAAPAAPAAAGTPAAGTAAPPPAGAKPGG
jgi:flagellar motility protein MotE (MotC chaperone)